MAEDPVKVGRYEIVRAVGKGAMGVVYEGRDPVIGRRVAIKMCRADVLEAANLRNEVLKRFERELRAAGALQHPNIITIYDVGDYQGVPYIAMEYIDGTDLRHVIEHRAEHTLPQMVEMCAKVCEALHEAHRHGVIHRDIKPANILLPDSGGVKVADFGIARVPNSELTIDGAIVGTPHYMSPEQFTGAPLDGRSDLFSLGIILYELLTGEKPFAGEALSTVMHHVLKRDPVAPGELNASVPAALNQVVLKSLAKRPGDRYIDGNGMAEALRESMAAEPRPDVLSGAPRRAQTLFGVTRPPVADPEPAVPPTTNSESTISRKNKTPELDETSSSMLWPVIGVGLFAVLIIVAVALRLQVPRASGDHAPSTPAATKDAVFVEVWGVESQEGYDRIAGAAGGDQITAIRRELPQVAAEKIRAVGAMVTVTDATGGTVAAETSVNPFGKPIGVPENLNDLVLHVESAGYTGKDVTVHKAAAGTWVVKPIVLMKAP